VPRLKWFTWLGLLGAGIASWGLIWLAISPYVAKQASRIEWLTSGLDESIMVRMMGLMAVVFLAVIGSDWLMRILGRNS